MDLIKQAQEVYNQHFPATTNFERAIFYSWYCSIRDCTFCYMSTQPAKPKNEYVARRTPASMIAEAHICKQAGWDIGFISGGVSAFNSNDFVNILSEISTIAQEKLWLNIGAISKVNIKKYKPYTQGVVAAIETVNKEIHKEICPSKPVEPYLEMFEHAEQEGLQKAMTLIVGVGETLDDYAALKQFIKKHDISKIHIYGLVPQEGTPFQHSEPPTPDYQATWIAKTRIDFPTIDIQAGIWKTRVQHVKLFLDAGANTISKFPAIRLFNSKPAKIIEDQAAQAGRTFTGTLTDVQRILTTQESNLNDKYAQYIEVMTKPK